MIRRHVPIALPSIGEEEWLAMREPIESGWLTQGPKVRAFEAAFAQRHKVPHALATTSCTTALHLALLALGVGPGDEVIVPAFTWVATANVVVYCGASPVLVDVDPQTYNLDPAAVASAVSDRTKAVIAVHLFGLCADIDAVRAAVPQGVAIVEDAACAAGAAYRGVPAGGLGDVGCFSFHPRKSITTGEGGMITTHSAQIAEKSDVLRNHGASVSEELRHNGPAPYLLPDFDELGFNFRMTDLQAAVGLVQLGKLDSFVQERRRLAAEYGEALDAIGWIQAPVVPQGYDHSWQAYVALVTDDTPGSRNKIMGRLEELGVSTRPGTHAVSDLGLYRRRLGWERGHLPVASHLQDQTIALPLHNRMTREDFVHVVDCLRSI